MNKAIVLGNIGRDAELRFTAGGTPVSTFSLATTEKFTGRDGEKREDTQWHRIVLWGKVAEALQDYLKKGKQVYVEGKLQTREWEGKDGSKQRTTEIRADRVVLLGGGGQRGSDVRRGEHVSDETVAAGGGDLSDDIPF